MNDNADLQRKLTDEAIDLVIRLQNDPANPVSQEMIRTWRARSDDHEGAWNRVSLIYGASGKVLAEQDDAKKSEEATISRRGFIMGALSLTAAVGVGSLMLPAAILAARADHMTDTGEIAHIELPDGSMATLGPQSALAIDMSDEIRRVRLLAGMCFFDIVQDAGRPFVAECADVKAKSFEAAYELSLDAGIITLAMERGSADAFLPMGGPASFRRLPEGDWLSFDPSTASIQGGSRDRNNVGSWRDNLLVADEEPVSVLVQRIGRWLPGRIITADPSIGQQNVSGIYDLSDPLAALEAVVHPTGARVRQISSILTVISPI